MSKTDQMNCTKVYGDPPVSSRGRNHYLPKQVCVLSILFLTVWFSAHDWQNFIEYLSPYLLYDLGDEQYRVCIDVLGCVRDILTRKVVVGNLQALRDRVIRTWYHIHS